MNEQIRILHQLYPTLLFSYQVINQAEKDGLLSGYEAQVLRRAYYAHEVK